MQKPYGLAVRALIAVSLPMAVVSCVDHDYDLSKDIDMTVTIGGQQLTIPTSDTDEYKLSQIFDLKPGSSVRAITTAGEYGLNIGDYILDQTTSSSNSKIEIEKVELKDINGSTATTALDSFVGTGVAERLIVFTDKAFNNINLDDEDVTRELVTLEQADTISISPSHFRSSLTTTLATHILRRDSVRCLILLGP